MTPLRLAQAPIRTCASIGHLCPDETSVLTDRILETKPELMQNELNFSCTNNIFDSRLFLGHFSCEYVYGN